MELLLFSLYFIFVCVIYFFEHHCVHTFIIFRPEATLLVKAESSSGMSFRLTHLTKFFFKEKTEGRGGGFFFLDLAEAYIKFRYG